MSYETARNRETHDAHQRLVDEFAAKYRCGKPTIVLLPGGMGSHLDRSTKKYVNDNSIPFKAYDPVWMDLGILFGSDVTSLEIDGNGRDAGSHIIVPNGPLKFLVNAYDGTKAHFEALDWNYIVYGYDWRRDLGEAAARLKQFLTMMREAVKKRRDCDPLPTTTLLAHSQGGLVAKVFIQRVMGTDGTELGRWCERVVTVGTPFYGTASHQDRYYQGQSPLNTFHGKKKVAKVAASMPGPYILMHADAATLKRDGAAIGLSAYPVTDADTGAAVDPYAAANFARYPSWVQADHVKQALAFRKAITKEVPAAAAERIFHLRSGLASTKGERLRWRKVDGASYDPEDGSPLQAVAGPGDGTVPFWSARLAQTASSRIYDLTLASDHGGLTEHDEVLKVVTALVKSGKLPKPSAVAAEDRSLGVEKASAAKTQAFVERVKAGTVAKDDPEANDPRIWRRILEDSLLA